ncbi:hypothetical protein Tco_1201780 [Tanacetum coccineum]
MLVSTSIIFSSANSIEYLVSTLDGTMLLKGLILAEVRLLSTRFHVLAIISSFASTSGPSKVLSVRESHSLRDSNSRKDTVMSSDSASSEITYRTRVPEYVALSDEEVRGGSALCLLLAFAIALSPGYVADSDPEEDPEEDSEDGPVDYPADGGDGNDDDFPDDDEEEEEASEEEEEEEHLAPTDSVIAPVVDHVPSSEETEPFETDESAPTPRSSQTRVLFSQTRLPVERLLALPIPPPSPLSPCSSPLPHIPSPTLLPPPSSLHLPPHVPTSLLLPSSPLLSIPPPVDRREDTPEAKLPPHKRLCLTTPTSRNEVGGSSIAAPRPTGGHRADYGVNARVTKLAAVQEQDTYDIYAVIEDAQDRKTQLFQRVDRLVEYRQHIGLIPRFRITVSLHRSHVSTLIVQISLLQGQLSAALGQIQALSARDQTHADDLEGAGSSA